MRENLFGVHSFRALRWLDKSSMEGEAEGELSAGEHPGRRDRTGAWTRRARTGAWTRLTLQGGLLPPPTSPS